MPYFTICSDAIQISATSHSSIGPEESIGILRRSRVSFHVRLRYDDEENLCYSVGLILCPYSHISQAPSGSYYAQV